MCDSPPGAEIQRERLSEQRFDPNPMDGSLRMAAFLLTPALLEAGFFLGRALLI